MLVHMLWLVFCEVYTSLVCFKSHIAWFRWFRRWVHISHGQWWEGHNNQEGPQGACTRTARCRGIRSVSMHVSLMCCNLYMCAYPVQCVSNTRLKSKHIGISFSPKDMGGTKGRTRMKGLDNGRPVQIDSQEACTRAFSMPLTTNKQHTLLKLWLGTVCVPSMDKRQWLQMWIHIVLCRECVCVWVIMLCVSIWALCVCQKCIRLCNIAMMQMNFT